MAQSQLRKQRHTSLQPTLGDASELDVEVPLLTMTFCIGFSWNPIGQLIHHCE